MFNSRKNQAGLDPQLIQDLRAQVSAIGKSQAVIEFTLQGEIVTANENFLATMGYRLDEIVGQHHRMFVEPAERESSGYRAFWEKLGRGEFDSGQYRRVARDGREVWLQASYNPILDASGRPVKVVKFASDITEQKRTTADFEGQLAAIRKVMAVIEFDLDGTIRVANDNFLGALGYTLDEVKGRHHRIFVDSGEANSAEYQAFWEKLGRGEFDAGRYRRVHKSGREVWIQASYNPIFDASGRPLKVVKYATDITREVKAEQSLQAAVTRAESVAKAAESGDLTSHVELDTDSEALKRLGASINAIIDTMVRVVTQVQEASGEINLAAKEIATGNMDLSGRTEAQAASLEETASSMEVLTDTVRKNADNARQANELAIGASEIATRGGAAVTDVVRTMSAISDSSRKISDIIGVIDGIAFQTNILALNAAVEAARAGEQGRGFAVVATEVRNLAQRSAAAAKEIKDLIGDSAAKVESGSRQVDMAGRTMEEIVTAVKRVTGIMTDITAASNEQATGIEQVNQAIVQMDETTQQNAALVEQAAASAKSMEQQSESLANLVSTFRVSANGHAPSLVAAASLERSPPAGMRRLSAAPRRSSLSLLGH